MVCFHCFSASCLKKTSVETVILYLAVSLFIPEVFLICKVGKLHQTVLLSIKCSFISVGWRTLELLVVLRDHFTATFKDSIEVVCA